MKKGVFIIKCKAKNLLQILDELSNLINYGLERGE